MVVASNGRISPKTVSVHPAHALTKAGRTNVDDWIFAANRTVWNDEDGPTTEPVERISRVRIRPVVARDEDEVTNTSPE
jgi:hypothetical protein